MTSGELPGELAGISLMDAVFETNLVPPNMWRDTVFIAPFGTTQIYQRFGLGKQENGNSSIIGTVWTGKTVYHCHFLDHEDQGMMAAMVILEDKKEDQFTYEHDHV
jgi:FtsP/CotA-like multicopper oxidase with cupredoxin domain